MSNYESPSKKPKITSYEIEDLDPDYVTKLRIAIPILNYGNLLQLILNYCYSLEEDHSSNKRKIKDALAEINSALINLKTDVNNSLNSITTKDKKNNLFNTRVIVEQDGNKYIKTHAIKAPGLIEAIINFTLDYYSKKDGNLYTTNVILKVSENKKLKQIMSSAPGLLLETYILKLYNSNVPNKNQILLNVLEKICKKLIILQTNYGFIHGDFHSRNICVFIDETGNIIITFIDFGYSVIRLPLLRPNTCKKIILSAAVGNNLERRTNLDLLKEPFLKGIDMFHLLLEFKSYEESIKTNERLNGIEFKDFNLFITLINKLFKKTNIIIPKNKHVYTRSNYFSNIKYVNLYPENFILIPLLNKNGVLYNNNNETKINIKNNGNYTEPRGKGLFDYYNNNNI